MFADLVGFTAHAAQRDPEQVKHLVDRSFQRLVADITAFGGTVDKIVGDGIVALFGAPRAHEDDPERAVRAALRMQRTVAETTSDWGATVMMRVGINTGEVLVGAIRAGGDYTAMGDTVNLASRLEGAAAPGEVLVGPETYEATAEAIEYDDRGEILVRGRGESVNVYVARNELAPPGRRRTIAKAPLVGRNLEHLQLTASIDTTIERNRAQLLMILGEAGMGKTRLAEEVAAAVESSHDAFVIEGRVLPYGETNPYRPMAEALADGLGIEPADSPSSAIEKIKIALAALDGFDSDDEVDGVVQPLMHILGYESLMGGLDKNRVLEEVYAGVRQYLGAVAATRPVVLVLGDVNWADEALLGMLESCLTGLANSRFVVIATARWTVDEERWIVPPGRHNTTVLNLDPLDRSASARLVSSLLGTDVDDELASILFDRSGGNPFFLEELTTYISEAGAVDGELVPRLEGVTELPDTLRGLVSARLDGLSSDERAMVEEASVIGRSGPVYALLLMAELDERSNPERVFRQLVGKDFFTTEADRWVFRSDLVRDIAYNTLTKTVRAEHHISIAKWLEGHAAEDKMGDGGATHVARHYRAAALLVDELGGIDSVPREVAEKAIHWLEVAGAVAAERDSHYAAGRMYAQAMELLDRDDPRRITAALGRATARMSLLELPGARDDVHEALDLARALDDDIAIANSLLLAGEIENLEADYDESRRILRVAIDRWTELGDRSRLAEALRLHGFASMMAGDQRQAEDDYSSALGIFVEIEDGSGEAWCQQNLAWLSFELGHVADAERRLTRAIELFERNNDAGGLGWALGLLAFVRFYEGNSDEARSIATRVQEEASKRGDRLGEAMMRLLLSSIHLWIGDCRASIEIATDALDIFRAIDTLFGEVQALGTLARAHVAVGNFEEAEIVLTECRMRAELAPGRPQVSFARMVSGATAMQRGDARTAIDYLAVDHGESIDLQILGSVDRGVTLALAHLQVGDVAAAREAIESLELTESTAPRTYLDSAAALLEVTAGNTDLALSYGQSVASSTQATYLDRRSALIAIGLAHARNGDENATRLAFGDAIEMIDSTDSLVSQAVTRLAFGIALGAVGTPDALDVRTAAQEQLDTLGLHHSGWQTLFAAAVGSVDAGAPASL